MAHVKFADSEELIKATVTPVSSTVVRIKTDTESNETGFKLFLDKDGKYPMDNGEYESYTTLYRQGEGWYELSNDGSVYQEPEPAPEPTEEEPAPEPTEEELAEIEQQQEIAKIQSQIQNLEAQIASTDYQIIKTYEYYLVGKESEYDIEALHAERQALRDQINELELQLAELATTE